MKLSSNRKTRLFIHALPLTTPNPSGIGHMLASIIQEMDSRSEITSRYELILFGPRTARDRVMSRGFKNARYQAQPLPQKIIGLLNMTRLLPPIDFWFGQGIYLFPDFANYPLTRRSKSITYIHDLCFLRHPEFLRPKVREVLQRNARRWARRSGSVVTVSRDAARELKDYYPEVAKKTTAVLNGINLEFFYPRSQEEINSVKKKYGVRGKYAMFVGNIEPRKNLERLVKAWAAMPERLRASHSLVLIGGDGWKNEAVIQAIKEARATGCTIVRPSKYVPDSDLPALYSGADAAILIAMHEGFGMPNLEAMACGATMLVSEIPTLREVSEDCAVYVDPLSVEDITRGLTELLGSPETQRKYGDIGPLQASKFTWHRTVDELMRVINEAAGTIKYRILF